MTASSAMPPNATAGVSPPQEAVEQDIMMLKIKVHLVDEAHQKVASKDELRDLCGKLQAQFISEAFWEEQAERHILAVSQRSEQVTSAASTKLD